MHKKQMNKITSEPDHHSLNAYLLLASLPDLQVQYASDRIAELLGWTDDQLKTEDLPTLLTSSSMPALQDVLLSAPGQTYRITVQVPATDKYYLVRIDRGRRFILLELTETTEPTEANEQPLPAAQPYHSDQVLFENTVNKLHQYSHTAYHDLMSPLNAITGFSELLAEDYEKQLDDYGKFSLQIIRDSAKKMSALIKGLSQFSRLQQLQPQLQDLEIEPILQGAWQRVQEQESTERKVNFQVDRPISQAYADAKMIASIIEIGLSNALKFTRSQPAADIHVRTAIDDRHWRLTITDNGVGFDPKYAEKAFGLFSRLVPDDQYEGIGLGLAVARFLADKMGGRIWLESEPGKGTTLTVEIPQRQ